MFLVQLNGIIRGARTLNSKPQTYLGKNAAVVLVVFVGQHVDPEVGHFGVFAVAGTLGFPEVSRVNYPDKVLKSLSLHRHHT